MPPGSSLNSPSVFFLYHLPGKFLNLSQSCVTLGKGEQLVPISIFIKGLKAQLGAQMCSCLPSRCCSHFPSHHRHREQVMPRKSTQNIPGCTWQLLLPAQPHTR